MEIPEVIFSNNHVLVVNKPAGWKSQPGDRAGGGGDEEGGRGDPKCLLSFLQSQKLGGGSQKDFLSPTHRLDQPCTGALIFAKNSKAASRIQTAWGKGRVRKRYWVVVEGGRSGDAPAARQGERRRGGKGGTEGDGLELLRRRSVRLDGRGPRGRQGHAHYRLSAILTSGVRKRGRSDGHAGGSVAVRALPRGPPSAETARGDGGRVCHLEWEHLLTLGANTPTANARHLLSMTTNASVKHQVRALLAVVGRAPIAGVLRYGHRRLLRGAPHAEDGRHRAGTVERPLPDGSLVLNVREVFLPTESLGGMSFLAEEPSVADIPRAWRDFFGLRESDVQGLGYLLKGKVLDTDTT